MNKYGNTEAYFFMAGDQQNLYWKAVDCPVGVKQFRPGLWAVIIGGKTSMRFYPTEIAAKIGLIDEVIKNLDDQKYQLLEVLDIMKEKKEREIK